MRSRLLRWSEPCPRPRNGAMMTQIHGSARSPARPAERFDARLGACVHGVRRRRVGAHDRRLPRAAAVDRGAPSRRRRARGGAGDPRASCRGGGAAGRRRAMGTLRDGARCPRPGHRGRGGVRARGGSRSAGVSLALLSRRVARGEVARARGRALPSRARRQGELRPGTPATSAGPRAVEPSR